MNKFFTSVLLLVLSQCLYAQNTDIDILHYDFRITINDDNDIIVGQTDLSLLLAPNTKNISLDFESQDNDKKGMKVSSVTINGKKAIYYQSNDKLQITNPYKQYDTLYLNIHYQGIPKDGLIISKNKYQSRTFFGDNWPNRAHHYLPTNDHPADKATVDWIITAPHHYEIIANGMLVERSYVDKKNTLTHWQSKTTIPTKVMVFAAANFSTSYLGKVGCVPITAWVFNQNKVEGFGDYLPAVEVLNYFINHIGEYPYYKLANVQSKTRYGGMENASCIFYYENSVNGKSSVDDLIAHEIVHQWFGNSVSELDWKHIWLSEGFATYLADLYMQHSEGDKVFHERLQKEKVKALQFTTQKPESIIPTKIDNINELLNPHSYQRAAWVLHTFHNKVGDELFWATIQNYYNRFKNGNASSEDFIQVAENSTHMRLKSFFNQWLERDYYPQIQIKVLRENSYNKTIQIVQIQDGESFDLELPIRFTKKDGSTKVTIINVNNKISAYQINKTDQDASIDFSTLDDVFCTWEVIK